MSNDERICYGPDGKSLSDQVPCSSRQYTHCCKSESICLNNGFCMPVAEPFVPYRGGCTNSKWDQGCPEYCNQPGDPYWLQWEDLKDGRHSYCCTWFQGNDGNRAYGCENETTFILPDRGVMYGGALLENITSFSNTTTTATTTTTTTGTASNSTTTNEAAPASAGSSSREITLGAGLGVPLGALMLAFLAWALFERRARLRERDRYIAMKDATGTYPVETAYPHGTLMNQPPVELDRSPGPAEIMDREK